MALAVDYCTRECPQKTLAEILYIITLQTISVSIMQQSLLWVHYTLSMMHLVISCCTFRVHMHLHTSYNTGICRY